MEDGHIVKQWNDSWQPTRVRWSPDGSLLAATCASREVGGRVRLIAADSLTTTRELDAGGNVFDLAWSTDGKHLATSTDALEVRVFRAAEGVQSQTLPIRDGVVLRLGFLGGTDRLLTATSEQVFRWRILRTGEEILRIEGVEIGKLFLTSSGTDLFTTDATAHGLHYRVRPPAGVRVLPLNPDGFARSTAGVGSLGFSADGRWLAATSLGCVTIFRYPARTGCHGRDGDRKRTGHRRVRRARLGVVRVRTGFGVESPPAPSTRRQPDTR